MFIQMPREFKITSFSYQNSMKTSHLGNTCCPYDFRLLHAVFILFTPMSTNLNISIRVKRGIQRRWKIFHFPSNLLRRYDDMIWRHLICSLTKQHKLERNYCKMHQHIEPSLDLSFESFHWSGKVESKTEKGIKYFDSSLERTKNYAAA